MAREVGLAESAVLRIWKAFGLQPHRRQIWKLSRARGSSTRSATSSGCTRTRSSAVVLCVDQESQIQAVDRTAPILPMLPGAPSPPPTSTSAPAPHADTLRWTSPTGRVIGALHARHRAIEFRRFLQTIDREVPDHVDSTSSRTPPPPHKGTGTAGRARWPTDHGRDQPRRCGGRASWTRVAASARPFSCCVEVRRRIRCRV
jgi:hypothetical protein